MWNFKINFCYLAGLLFRGEEKDMIFKGIKFCFLPKT